MRWAVYFIQVLFCILCVVNIEVIKTQRETCDIQKFSINADAAAKFSVIISLRPGGSIEGCGSLSIIGIQILSTIQWAVDQLNRANFISGVKLGFDVYDDCGVVNRSVAGALDAVGIFPFHGDTCYISQNASSPLHLGIFGPSRSQTAEGVLDALAGMDLPVISPFATYPDLSKYSNFLRTTHSDESQAKAIVSILKELGWTYISGLHTNDNYGIKGMEMVKEFAKQEGICVDVVEQYLSDPFNTTTFDKVIMLLQKRQLLANDTHLGVVYFGQKNVLKGLLVRMHNVLDSSPPISQKLKNIHWIMSDFVGTDLDIFSDLQEIANRTITMSPVSYVKNEIQNFYMKKWNAAVSNNVSDTIGELMRCTDTQQPPAWISDYTTPVVDAVYVFAEALRQKHNFICPNESGLCKKFHLDPKEWVTSIRMITLRYSDLENGASINVSEPSRTISFRQDGEIDTNDDSPLYIVNYYTNVKDTGSFKKLGEYSKVNLTISNRELLKDYPVSVCNGNCSSCTSSPSVQFAFVDGDIYIIGVINIHETDLYDAFRCGRLRNNSYDLISIESFLYVTGELRNITGIDFGAIVFNDCYSPARISLIISQFLSGAMTLTKPNSNEVINPKKVVAVVGSTSSGSALLTGLLLTRLNIPFISSASSSPDLDDRINFPYFLRTVPSDKEQAKAMISIIKKMGWEFVSLLYVANNYGSKGKEAFLQFANQSNICVADPPLGIAENSKDTGELSNILFQLRNQKSKVVVYFGTDTKIMELLTLMKGSTESFIFLASEDWGNKEQILQIGGIVTLGSIIMKFESHERPDNSEFANYIKNLRPESNTRNPWFREFWNGYFQCDFKNTFNVKYRNTCKVNLAFDDTFIQSTSNDQRIIHAMDAVSATGIGVKKALESICLGMPPQNYPCDRFFQFPNAVINQMRDVTLIKGREGTRIFREDGNGNIGFDILNVQKSVVDGEPTYIKVGYYKDDSLTILSGFKFYASTNDVVSSTLSAKCSGDTCDHCTKQQPVNPVTSTPQVVTSDAFRAADYVIIGIVISVFVLIIISLTVIIFCTRKQIHALKLQLCQRSDYIKPYVNTHSSRTGISNDENLSSGIIFHNLDSDQHMKDWNETNAHLGYGQRKNGGSLNGGLVNKSFVGNSSYLQTIGDSHDQSNSSRPENDDYPISTRERIQSAVDDAGNFGTLHTESSDYSRSTGHSLNASNSFQKPPDPSPHGGHLAHIKKQPRTQLAVSPSNRPELPSRTTQDFQRNGSTRPTSFPSELNSVSPEGEGKNKDRVEHNQSSNIEWSPPSGNGHIPNKSKKTVFNKGTSIGTSPTGLIPLSGSLEKISRV
ncbi:hypothetical protein CHS0354_004866 [Potamilus streckersoni]|uniref:Receptor ligand binding region domain-containing protein n=1 Tax=Potamilus streckersoni TaxID=2493646 RepID=A0AAE0S966_9BIVA|nr:hypothetical protein CHS0354_004866 [Potamilus streckersoni]